MSTSQRTAEDIARMFEDGCEDEWQPAMSQAQWRAWLTYGYIPFGETTPEPMPSIGVTAEDFSFPWEREEREIR
jgi:hypothetical protein